MKAPLHCAAFAAASILLTAGSAQAVIIDNDIPAGTVGHWSVDVATGGESQNANITANRFAFGDTVTEDVLFEYRTYVDTGSGGTRLSGSAPTLTGDDTVSSAGSFVGSNGNIVNWTAISSIADGSSVMTNTFVFSVADGTLGDLRLFQYLDEDIEVVDDDVFLTRGSPATLDLELFTIDNEEVYGVSHGGAYAGSQGLVSAVFAGWAACEYNDMNSAIAAGTQGVSTTGVIGCGLSSFSHPQLGSVFGPADIVSVLAWDVDPGATSATIITTLGGVPDASGIPDEPVSVPEPGVLSLLGLGLAGLGLMGRRSASRAAQR